MYVEEQSHYNYNAKLFPPLKMMQNGVMRK